MALLTDDSLDSRAVHPDAGNLNSHLGHTAHQIAEQYNRHDRHVGEAPVDGVLAAQSDALRQQVATSLGLCEVGD